MARQGDRPSPIHRVSHALFRWPTAYTARASRPNRRKGRASSGAVLDPKGQLDLDHPRCHPALPPSRIATAQRTSWVATARARWAMQVGSREGRSVLGMPSAFARASSHQRITYGQGSGHRRYALPCALPKLATGSPSSLSDSLGTGVALGACAAQVDISGSGGDPGSSNDPSSSTDPGSGPGAGNSYGWVAGPFETVRSWMVGIRRR